MPDQITESESIPPVRVAEFPPGQLALQSPEGWIYQRIDGKDVYPNANQQPVSAYIDDVKRDYVGRLWFHYPPGSPNAVYVDEVPVWDWDGTNLAAKHFRPVPTSEPVDGVAMSIESIERRERQNELERDLQSIAAVPELSSRIYAIEQHLGRIADALEASVQLAHQDHRRIATALEGILADLTKGNDADKT